MNQNQPLWLRISHNGEVQEQLHVMDWRAALQSIYESYDSHNGRKVQMVIEVSNQPIRESLLTSDQQTEQQIQARALSNPDEIIYEPDVTLGECELAWASPEGQAMFRYQRAENRMGVDPELLERVKREYESKFPRVAPHGPKWTNT